jgi:hypothetical protein
MSSFDITHMRSMVFSNSRTLPGQVYIDQTREGIGRQGVNLNVVLMVELIEEMLDEDGGVLPPFPQGRQEDGDHVQPVVQVLPELLLGDGFLEVPVGGADDADVHRDGLGPTHAFELAFLETRKEFDLDGRARCRRSRRGRACRRRPTQNVP